MDGNVMPNDVLVVSNDGKPVGMLARARLHGKRIGLGDRLSLATRPVPDEPITAENIQTKCVGFLVEPADELTPDGWLGDKRIVLRIEEAGHQLSLIDGFMPRTKRNVIL